MMNAALHYVSAEGTHSWTTGPNGLIEGSAEPGAKLAVIVDVADETYVLTTVPRLRGTDGARLLQRRLEREFPAATLRVAIPMHQNARGGGHEIILIATGADTAVNAALQSMAERHAVCGVYTPALLVSEWARRARSTTASVLVILPTPAGLRLVFLQRGLPILSRLTSGIASGTTPVEIARTVQYLQNTQRIERGEPVDLWFWGISDALIAQCVPTDTPHRLAIAPQSKALPDPHRLGFEALLQMVASHPSPIQLAADPLRFGWFAHRIRRWSVAAAVATLVTGAAAAATLAWRSSDLQRQTVQLQARGAAQTEAHNAFEAQVARDGLKIDDVRLLPEVENTLTSSAVDLQEVFRVVGRGYGARTEVRVLSLEYYSAAAVPTTEETTRTCGNELVPGSPSIQVTFTLADQLDVRQRADALAFVRRMQATVAPWRAIASSAVLGERDPLAMSGGRDANSTAAEWTSCLLRGGAS